MQELRKGLDNMLEYQANEAPQMSLKHAHYPAREGSLMDFLFEREQLKDEANEVERAEVTEEVTEESEEMELDDDRIPLEDDEALRAAEADVFGGDVNITQTLREIQLEDQKALSVEAAMEQQEQKDSSEAAGNQQGQPAEDGKRRGVRAKVSDFMKGSNTLERKSSTNTLRRKPSTLSQKKPRPWRN